MNPVLVRTISLEVYRRFPEVNGVRPKVQVQKAMPAGPVGPPTYLLTYQTVARLPGNASLPRSVRVVADTNGRILKISTSR